MSGGRIPLRTSSGGGSPNNQVLIMPPPPGAPPADCPTVPPLANWLDLTETFPCAVDGVGTLGAIVGNVFTAEPNVDTTTNFGWAIDTSGMTVPHVCLLIPGDQAVLEAQFRSLAVATTPIQAIDNTILSPWFLLRPDGSGAAVILAYQPSISGYGDPADGITATVTFTVRCIPIAPE